MQKQITLIVLSLTSTLALAMEQNLVATKSYALRVLDVEKAAEIAKALSSTLQTTVDQANHTLSVTDTTEKLHSLGKVLSALDRNTELEIVQLYQISSSNIADVLALANRHRITSPLRLVPHNSKTLVALGNERALNSLESVLQELGQLEVKTQKFYLRYIAAKDMIKQPLQYVKKEALALNIPFEASYNERRNSVKVTAPERWIEKAKTIIENHDIIAPLHHPVLSLQDLVICYIQKNKHLFESTLPGALHAQNLIHQNSNLASILHHILNYTS